MRNSFLPGKTPFPKTKCDRIPTKTFLSFFGDFVRLEPSGLPNHLADESQTRQPDTPPGHPHRTILTDDPVRMARWCIRPTRLTLVCEVIRYHLVQFNKISKKDFCGWRLAIAFLHLFPLHSFLHLTSFLSQKQKIKYILLNQYKI